MASSSATDVSPLLINNGASSDDHSTQPLSVRVAAVCVTACFFAGYSALVALQEKLKDRLGIHASTHEAYVFGVCVSTLFFANWTMTIFHNVVFSFLRPRHRVIISFLCLMTAHVLLFILYFVEHVSSVSGVGVAYAIAGIGIGAFEPNVYACLTPLGRVVKGWSVLGIPIGFNGVTVGTFGLFSLFPHDLWLEGSIFLFAAVLSAVAIAVWIFLIPDVPFAATSRTSFPIFVEHCKSYQCWLPIVWKHCLAMMFSMFCSSLFSSVVLYVYSGDELPLWPHGRTSIPKNAFLFVYYIFAFVGDFSSRKLAYLRAKSAIAPFYFLSLSVAGAALVLSKVTILAPVGMMLVMFANGSVYAHTTQHIDILAPPQFVLVALSAWRCCGDFGSFVASQTTQPLRTAVGKVTT